MPFVMPQIEIRGDDYKTNAGNWRRGFGKVYRDLMRDTITFWHDKIFPSHFTPRNDERYQFEKRSPGYIKNTKRRYGIGQGKYVDNVFTGMSFRWMMSLVKYTATAPKGTASATATMSAPTYFTSPKIGTFVGSNGKTYTITRQPDKVKEITQVNANDLAQIQKFMQRRYDELCDRYIRQETSAKAA